MTRYDPFAYGSVRLDGKEGAPAAAPEDVLFADAGPVKHAPPAADSSWSLLDEDVGNLLPGSAAASTASSAVVEFGTEILGESMAEAPSAPAPAPAAPRPRPATSKASAPAKSAAPKAEPLARPVDAGPSQRPVTPTAKAPAAAPDVAVRKSPAEAPRRAPAGLPGRRNRPFAAVAVPLGMCAVGGTVGSWMLVMQQNPVMAGIVAVATVVGAAFAWLLLRG